MSRLDSFIRRLLAQRECLALAARLIAGVPGPVLELGLGNGRTFDHLREILPGREIFAFDRQALAHPDCVPAADRLVLGDFCDTLPEALRRIGAPAALAHADVGTGVATADAETIRLLAEALPPLMRPDGVIVSDQRLDPPGWNLEAGPAGVAAGRYFLYRGPAVR
jgi:hypothetical protein